MIFQIITAAGSVATAIAVFLLYKQIKSQKQELVLTNFSTISNHIDDIRARSCRKILYNSHNDLERLVANYPEKSKDKELDDLNEVAKYTAGIYEKVGFMLDQDDNMKKLILDLHGYTIARLWKIIEPLHDIWKDQDATLDYTEFKKVGIASYDKFKKPVDNFMAKNYTIATKLSDEVLKKLFKKALD